MNNDITNICIICCFYNTNPKYLEECFKSIDMAIWMFKRYYNNIPVEVHVMDDGSNNIYTINMFKTIINRYPYVKHWSHDKNTTLATAINDLNQYTPNDSLVIYIDSDDMMAPNRIIVQYEVMTKYNHYRDIVLCATNTCTPNIIIGDNIDILSKYVKYEIITSLTKNIIVHPSIAYKINYIRDNNIKYDDNLKCTQDFDFYLQILSKNLKILLIPDALTWWRQYSNDNKPDSNRHYIEELHKIQIKYSNNNLRL